MVCRDTADFCLVTFRRKILLNSHISPSNSCRISTKMFTSSPDQASFISFPIWMHFSPVPHLTSWSSRPHGSVVVCVGRLTLLLTSGGTIQLCTLRMMLAVHFCCCCFGALGLEGFYFPDEVLNLGHHSESAEPWTTREFLVSFHRCLLWKFYNSVVEITFHSVFGKLSYAWKLDFVKCFLCTLGEFHGFSCWSVDMLN